ncbi:MAG: hypothetical protein ALMCE001_12190 [Methanocorpusculum sp. MCE]|nr:MAG: hypothetical protein ALMCE001_12190 [Methanocorpusculum sp. MCE]
MLTLSTLPNPPLIITRRMNTMDRPRRPRPTTDIPMTEPLAKETFTASAIPRFAALVVLTFAFVALCIPIYPAVAERVAPMT